MELSLAQVVIDPCDSVRSQFLKDAIIFKLFDYALHFSALLLANNDCEVIA